MDVSMETEPVRCGLSFSRPTGDTLLIRLTGSWRIGQELPSADDVWKQFDSDARVKRLAFDTKGLAGWDSGFLTFLIKIRDLCLQGKIKLDTEGLPEGVKRLLALASAVPEKKDTRARAIRGSFLSQVGEGTIAFAHSTGEMLAFISQNHKFHQIERAFSVPLAPLPVFHPALLLWFSSRIWSDRIRAGFEV
jgi:phospholipid/cholesterol/gamma-HCH transport system permease protein